jgi:hypothetical protein
MMLKYCAAIAVAMALSAGAASAHGGSAGSLPIVGYTDLPAYTPKPIKPLKRAHQQWRGPTTSR